MIIDILNAITILNWVGLRSDLYFYIHMTLSSLTSITFDARYTSIHSVFKYMIYWYCSVMWNKQTNRELIKGQKTIFIQWHDKKTYQSTNIGTFLSLSFLWTIPSIRCISCVVPWFAIKRKLKQWGQQILQYQQNDQWPLTSTLSTTMTYVVGKYRSWLGVGTKMWQG